MVRFRSATVQSQSTPPETPDVQYWTPMAGLNALTTGAWSIDVRYTNPLYACPSSSSTSQYGNTLGEFSAVPMFVLTLFAKQWPASIMTTWPLPRVWVYPEVQ